MTSNHKTIVTIFDKRKQTICPKCGSDSIVRAGTRLLKSGIKKQLFRCNSCWSRFSSSEKHGKHTPGRAILKAICLTCEGCSYDEVCVAIKRLYGIKRNKSTISRWITERTLPYLDIRDRIQVKSGSMVRSHLFSHNALNYRFQVHMAKLTFAKQFEGLTKYLISLPNWLDHSLFERAAHCSQLKGINNPGLRQCNDTLITKMTSEAVPLATSNFKRHDMVEAYLLYGDRNTIAVEVPVYFKHPELGLVAGHIDILQVAKDRVTILDYKPNAANENPDKVVTQLSMYAHALSRRAKIPFYKITCAYFDEHEIFYFLPTMLEKKSKENNTGFQIFKQDRTNTK